MKRTLAALAAAAGALALGAAPSPALGAVHTLNLSGPSTAVVGHPVVFQLTGTAAPPDEFWALSWIDVYAIPPSVVSTCPPDDASAAQLATWAGGNILTVAMRPNKDAAGNFSNQVGATPSTPGTILICAYTVNEEGFTLSRASLTLNILGGGGAPSPGEGAPSPGAGAPPAAPGGAKPMNVQRPRVARAGNRLVCRPGTWTNDDSRFSYRWRVNGRRLRGARGRTLAAARRLRGRAVQCRVTASNAAGDATAVSPPLRIGGRS